MIIAYANEYDIYVNVIEIQQKKRSILKSSVFFDGEKSIIEPEQ